MNFIKLQAAGNDFILAEPISRQLNWSKLAVKWCDRHFGVGADGLLVVSRIDDSSINMRIFNPDGSEAETCGNGLRCAAKYACENGLINRRIFSVRTLAGDTVVSVPSRETKITPIDSVTVTMTTPVFTPKEIPVLLPDLIVVPVIDYLMNVKDMNLKMSFISMGNPHAITFISRSLATFPLEIIGPLVEHDPIFPRRTNFEVGKVINRRTVKARVWERGVGETLACGTGACAIAVSALHHGFVDSPVDIILPGGTLTVEWSPGERVKMTGPVSEVYRGEINS